MMTLFEALDCRQEGALSFDQFATIAHDPQVTTWLASMDIETDDLETLFQLIDEDDSGKVTIDELTTRIPRIKGAARSVDVLALRRRLADLAKGMNIPSGLDIVKLGGSIGNRESGLPDFAG